MSNENQSGGTTFGYLSTVHATEYGYFGGYLIVSELGRPLEFHCTTPVRPSRAQEILYGPTMQRYLLGEQIGGTLLKAATLTPRIVLTDEGAMLALRPQAGVPMALLRRRRDELDRGASQSTAPTAGDASDGSEADEGLRCYDHLSSLDGLEMQLAPGFQSDRDTIVEALALISPHVEIAEPFGRIHEAIREAQRIGGCTLEGHGEAA
jgi:hypothetical protein